jgi:arylsulfatase A-like enzyme
MLGVRLRLGLVFIAIFVCSAWLEEHCNAADPPSIVLLMGDDHGWDETGYNQHPYLKTPVLDEMAATGLRLDRFYSAASSCSPTRGSIITGRHPNRYGTFTPGCSLRPEEISIAKILHDAGYACGHFGKWHLGPVKAASPTNPGRMGFDSWLSHDNFFELNPYFSRDGGSPQQFQGESSEIIVGEAKRFIDQAKTAKKPFFVVIWFGSPHEPYSALPQDLAIYDHLPSDFANRRVKLTSNETGKSTERLQRDVLRERFAEITAMDRSIGQLRNHLSEIGQRENTLLWYCGDNGTPQEATATIPFRGMKGTIYEGGIRVPGIVEWPRLIAQPRPSDLNCVTSDILPTLCDLVQKPLPARPLDGISLVPLLEGKMTTREVPIGFWNFGNAGKKDAKPYIDAELQKGTTPLAKLSKEGATRNFNNYHHPVIDEQDFNGPRALLDNRFKLVIDGGNKSGYELFDIRHDPAETRNVIEQHRDVAERLAKQLRDWQKSVLNSLTGADYL